MSAARSPLALAALVALALAAFAGNSLLARVALRDGGMDAASFTALRLVSGALVLWALVSLRRAPAARGSGDWISALALFAYAALFSLAYVQLEAGAGALLLFGAVQATMIGRGLAAGERLARWQWLGLLVALAGLVGLLLPGLSAPPPLPSLLMLGAGVAWGAYSLRGRGALDPLRTTAGNFLRTLPMAALFLLALLSQLQVDTPGLLAALASGALASGVGYAIWYTALPSLRRASAATLQLAVPLIVAVAGVLWLGEPATLRLLLAGAAILGGVALVLRAGKPAT
ncbi:EamA family transporter [Arenimonas sp. SCN 70-307]|uniref:EamA family transporter n=1 Tax=Arenimonas sp. SCN 70-307 TaxID=1660089 RepID=UPI000AEEC60B|nr:EamA family transporter [Arenimonas sp. SCN 70-307]